MKNTKKVFGCKHSGGWIAKDPEKVVKIAVVYDSYKESLLEEMFKEGFKKAGKYIDGIKVSAKDIIWTEISDYSIDGKLKICCRYFTPQSNRERIKREGVEYEN